MDIMHLLPEDLQTRYNVPFKVKGSFYKLKIGNQMLFKCRNVLGISSVDYETQDSLPDAIAIMMNPGSSEPIAGDEIIDMDTFTIESISGILNNQMVNTFPDPTQSQLMNLMFLLKWQHVRILNLSDIRDQSSKSFLKKLTKLRRREKFEHSVFCRERREELELYLQRKPTAPIILGWGKEERLNVLANMAMSYLCENQIEPIGMSSGEGSVLYRHPYIPNNPKKNADWLEYIIRTLDE